MNTNLLSSLTRFFLLLVGLSLSVLNAQDTIPPVINLNPGSNQSIELRCDNPPYVDPGATAYDLRDGNLTYGIKVFSNVNTRRPGKYFVRYTVSDFTGNKTTVDRVVNVENTKFPIHFDAFNSGTSFMFTTYQITPTRMSHNWMLDGDTMKAFKDEIAMLTNLTDGKEHEVCIVEKYCDGDTSLKYCELVLDTIANSRWVTFKTFRDLNSNCRKENDEQSYYQFWGIFNDTGKMIPVFFGPSGSIGYSIIDTNTGYRIPVYMNTLDTFNLTCFGHDTIIAPQTYKDTILHLTMAFSCKPRLSDYEVFGLSASGRVFPGQKFQVYSSSTNRNFYSYNNCGRPDSGWLVFELYGKGRFTSTLSGSLTPDTFTSNKVVVKVGNLNIGNLSQFAALDVFTDTTAQSGDTITIKVSIVTPNAETNKLNNSYYRTFEVRNSYDPNMKTASHEKVSPGFDQAITYNIDFQNTGTAEAINIVLRDTLDDALDTNSYTLLGSSHAVQVTRRGRGLSFRFDGINLPDSGTNQAASHGFVAYSVQPKVPMSTEQIIRNTAYIYFDFNPPVVTNTAETYTFVSNGSVANQDFNQFKIWPNPATNTINFLSISNDATTATIMDVYGKTIRHVNAFTSGQMNISDLPSGMYLLNLKSAQFNATYKVIKE